MKELVTHMDSVIGPWVMDKCHNRWVPGFGTTLGLVDMQTGQILAGIIFHDFNGANCCVTVAAAASKKEVTRKFVWACCYYVFEQLGCKRVTALVASSNSASIKLCLRTGFTLDAELSEGHPDGALLVFGLHKSACKWLALGERYGI